MSYLQIYSTGGCVSVFQVWYGLGVKTVLVSECFGAQCSVALARGQQFNSSTDLLKICVKMGASWSAQTFRQAGEIPSGPGAFLDFCFLKTRFTSSTQTLSTGWVVGGRDGVVGVEGRWMCEMQIRAAAGCQSGHFKSVVKHIEIISQLLILHRLWGRSLVLGDVPQSSPYWHRIVCWKLFFNWLIISRLN